MSIQFLSKFNNVKFHSNILCIILRINYLVEYVVLHVKSLRWMRQVIDFFHEESQVIDHDSTSTSAGSNDEWMLVAGVVDAV
jgi:hypothetical protein